MHSPADKAYVREIFGQYERKKCIYGIYFKYTVPKS